MLRLRPFKDSDATHLPAWIVNERDFYYWSAGKFTYPLTAEQVLTYVKKIAADEGAWPLTVLDGRGQPVGHILLRRADYIDNSIHLGFVLLAPEQRGTGQGRALVRLVQSYVQYILGMRRLTLGVFANNLAAQHCYKREGFRNCSGTASIFMRHQLEFLGEQWEIVEMEWLADEK